MNRLTRFHDGRSELVDEDCGALHATMLADDRAYFRACAQIESVAGWQILTPKWSDDGAGICMVEPPMDACNCPDRLISTCRQRGYNTLRFYLPGPTSHHQAWPVAFDRSEELVMCGACEPGEAGAWPKDVSVHVADVKSDPVKIALFGSDEKRPDGKPSVAADYVMMERAKIDAGYMRGYLIAYRGMAAGCFGVSLGQPGLTRLKNLFVAPRFRGLGLARVVIHFAANLGISEGYPTLGAFAIKADGTQSLYQKCGLHPVGSQTEMTAPLSLLATEGR